MGTANKQTESHIDSYGIKGYKFYFYWFKNQICWTPNPKYLWIWPYLEVGLCRYVKLRWYHSMLRWAKFQWLLFLQGERDLETCRYIHREDKVKTEAGIRIPFSQLKEHQGLPAPPAAGTGPWDMSSLRAFRESMTLLTPDSLIF